MGCAAKRRKWVKAWGGEGVVRFLVTFIAFDFLFSFFECNSVSVWILHCPSPSNCVQVLEETVISACLPKGQNIAELIWLILCCYLWICLLWQAFCGRELICLALVGAAGEPVPLEVSTSHIWACVLTLPYFRLACLCEAQLLHQCSSPSALEAKQ